MKQITRHRINYALADFLATAAGWFCFNILRYYTLPTLVFGSLWDFIWSQQVVLGQILIPPTVVAIYAISGSYNKSNTLYKSRMDEILNALIVSLFAVVLIFLTVLINDNIPERITSYELMLMLLGCLFLPVCIVRLIILNNTARQIRRGDFVMRTLIVGADSSNSTKVQRIISSIPNTGLMPVAFLENDLKDIEDICQKQDIQAIIVLPSASGMQYTAETINRLYPLGRPLFITTGLHNLLTSRPKISSVTSEPLVDITNANISPAMLNLKRLGDIISSSLALILLIPVYAAIAISIKADSPGPILYRQTRIGYHKKPFKIIKFRTMSVDAEDDGPMLTSEDDPRVTGIGHFLRKYRLDELPQFWNVLKGEMSLVGPRPERDYFIRQIVARHPSYSLIHQVRPGITSWGMVKYGYASNVDQMLERLPYDLLYIENVSLGVDLKILFHTVKTVINGRGQ